MAGEQDQAGEELPKAGWYADPEREGRERLWDGEQWRTRFRPLVAGREEATPAGWYPNPGGLNSERLWDGERWVGSGRPVAFPVSPAEKTPGTRYLDPNPPQPLTHLGRFVIGALGLAILSDIAMLVINQRYIGYLNDRLDGSSLRLDDVGSAITNLNTVHTVAGALFLVTAVLFTAWFFRAYRNLVRAGIGDLRCGTGWAVGGWFVPFFSWVRPKEIANDICRGSEALEARRLEGWHGRPVPSLVHWWWGFWLAGSIASFAGRTGGADNGEEFFGLTEHTLRDERVRLWIGQTGLALLIVAAVLAIAVVWRLSGLQDEALSGFELDDPAFAAGAGALAALDTKTCPECAEQVKAAARKCRFCGHRFEDPV